VNQDHRIQEGEGKKGLRDEYDIRQGNWDGEEEEEETKED
jgi:hypothetical protein